LPRLRGMVVNLYVILCEIDRHIGGIGQVILEELLNDVALVSTANHEILDAVDRIDLHDVPENRTTADLDHRLRHQYTFLADASSHPTCQDHSLHCLSF